MPSKPIPLPQKAPCILGESPHWDANTNTLFWVDIYGKKIFQYHLNTQTLTTITMPEMIGHIIPTTQNKAWISLQSGIYELDLNTKKQTLICPLEPNRPNNRPNDGKCDPEGRLWVGTIDFDFKPGASSLYRLDKNNKLTEVLNGLTLANGLAWDKARNIFYFIDSHDAAIQKFTYDPKTGHITNQATAFLFDKSLGLPDGMCIDPEGNLWIAGFGGGQVTHFAPDTGKILETIKLPTLYPTACTLGGEKGNQLFITSSSHLMTREAAQKENISGLTYVVNL